VRIRQVLLNLYSNAAKFTQEGSIKLTLWVDADVVTISVQDTGEGIHPDDLSGIFEEFRQGSAGRKKARAGSGLGLTISRQLLHLMGGRIWVESTYGKGSTFYVTLPIYQEEAASEPPVASSEAIALETQ
jgi:signal transduction histidine kinase